MADELVADVLLRIEESKKWKKGIIISPTKYLEQERWNEVLDREEINKDSYEYLGFVAQQAIEEKKALIHKFGVIYNVIPYYTRDTMQNMLQEVFQAQHNIVNISNSNCKCSIF